MKEIMASIRHLLLVPAIAFTVSVSAKAPPGHGVAKESKSTVCPYFDYVHSLGGTPIVTYVVDMNSSDLICYVEPVRNWIYVDVVPSLYAAPYVERPQAFYARSSC